jgi:hypothetical protein
MIMMDAEADESTLSACALPTCHCQAVLLMSVRRSAFGVQRSAFSVLQLCNHIEDESVPISLLSFIVTGL